MAENDHKAEKEKNMTNFKQTTRKDFWTGKKIDEFFAGQSKFYYIAVLVPFYRGAVVFNRRF